MCLKESQCYRWYFQLDAIIKLQHNNQSSPFISWYVIENEIAESKYTIAVEFSPLKLKVLEGIADCLL